MRKITILLACLLISMQAVLAQRTITGTVTSADDGSGIPGVSIVVKGTTVGVVTDVNGNYTLTVPADATTLVFSFIGMKTQEVVIGGRTSISIVLESDVIAMAEFVVSGVAGATPREKLSITVDRVGTETLEAVPATSAAGALQGKISGVTVVQASGNPGQSANIRLRGSTNLLGDSKPLIIIDGIMMEGDLGDVNVDDIESMEVVKGAAASALYGSRAGAGVINIRTKRGNLAKEGTTSVRFRGEAGWSSLPKKVELSNSHQYDLAPDWQLYDKFTKYEGVTFPEGYEGGYDPRIAGNKLVSFSEYADKPYAFLNDHQDRIFEDGTYWTLYAGVAHNTGKTAIFTSFENTENSGIVWNTSGSQRTNFRLNADFWLGEKISLSSSTFISRNLIDIADGRFIDGWGGGQGSAFFNVLFFEPDVNLEMDAPPGFLLDKYYIWPNHWQTDNSNPLHSLYYQQRGLTRNILMQALQGTYYATDWLNFAATYSIERNNYLNENFRPKGFSTAQQTNTDGGIYKGTQEVTSQVASLTANTTKNFGEFATRGKLSYLYEAYDSYFFDVNASDLRVSRVTSLNAIYGDKTVRSNEIKTRSKNIFAIIDADYKDRYIVSALFRMDGSSLFGENERWNPYYRLSAAYRITEDINIRGFDELRVRAAYGISGNRPGFAYQYETYSVSQGNITKTTVGNTNLKPSETTELEFGLNAAFLNMFDLEVTYSDILTEGAFVNVPLPAATGFQYQWQNAADIAATAFEISLGFTPIKKANFTWRNTFNFDKITQKITRLDAPPFRVGPTINALQVFYIREGEPFGIMYGGDWVRTLEQMQAQLEPEDNISNYVVNSDGYVIRAGTEGTNNEAPIRLRDENGDEAFTQIADMNPDFNLSWMTMLNYKNWSLNMLWHWKQGGDVYNQTKQWLFRDSRHGEFDQAGKPENQKKVDRYYQAFYRVNEPNTYFVEDGTYLKLRELSLYYNFRKSQLSNAGMNFVQNVRIGVIGRNLLTFTNYSGWDPEVAQVDYAQSNSTNYFIDMFNYPNYRTFTFTLEVNF